MTNSCMEGKEKSNQRGKETVEEGVRDMDPSGKCLEHKNRELNLIPTHILTMGITSHVCKFCVAGPEPVDT